MSHSFAAITSPDVVALQGGPQRGLSWRHAATLMLLMVTLPVFALAATAAMPVLLVVASAEAMRQLWNLRGR